MLRVVAILLNSKLLAMKRIFLIPFLFLTSGVFGQESALGFATEFAKLGNIGNTGCASAFRFCKSVQQEFDFTSNMPASSSSQSLYYYYNIAGPNTNGLQVKMSPGTGTWELFGPYTSFSPEICDQVQAYVGLSASGTVSAAGSYLSSPSAGFYVLKITTAMKTGKVQLSYSGKVRLNCSEEFSCSNCVTSFSPTPGKYILSAWMKEDGDNLGLTTYTHGAIRVSFEGSSVLPDPMVPSGAIIDGWQRIEAELDIPTEATGITIELQATGSDVFFDDIRFFPIDGSMMSYVYDPVSLRLMAELDERNYATLYEYDEEGKLIRVKKETERGIMTIQENRDNIKKH